MLQNKKKTQDAKYDGTLYDNEHISELVTVAIVEKAKDRLLKWLKREYSLITTAVSLFVIIFGFLGIKFQCNVMDRAKEINKVYEDTLPQVSGFAQDIKKMKKEYDEFEKRTEDKASDIEKLKKEIELLKEESKSTMYTLKKILKEVSIRSAQLENTQKKYEEEIKNIEIKNALFLENQKHKILIKYSTETKSLAINCKDILASNGFKIELTEVEEEFIEFFIQEGFNQKIRFFNTNLLQKTNEIINLLKPISDFKVERFKDDKKKYYSFIIWILKL